MALGVHKGNWGGGGTGRIPCSKSTSEKSANDTSESDTNNNVTNSNDKSASALWNLCSG